MLKIIFFGFLLFLIQNVFSNANGPYNAPYIYVNTSSATLKSDGIEGFYILNSAKTYNFSDSCSLYNLNFTYYKGTYQYYKSGSSSFYLYEVVNQNSVTATPYLIISASMCSIASYKAAMDSGCTILGASNGSWPEASTCSWKNSSGGNVTINIFNNSVIQSSAPTIIPTKIPTIVPTNLPTPPQPTAAPHYPTINPTNVPTTIPTTRPTDIPTTPTTVYVPHNCMSIKIDSLSDSFPLSQSKSNFSVVKDITYNSRYIWTNGFLKLYFSTRYNENGDWVLSNTTYHLVQKNGTSISHPTAGFTLWDHFSNDNIYGYTTPVRVTLPVTCVTNVTYPTPYPTLIPTATPTSIPTKFPTHVPTSQPTENCKGLLVSVSNHTCSSASLSFYWAGSFSQQSSYFNGHLYWKGVLGRLGYTIYWSNLFDAWAFDGDEGYSAIALNSGDSLLPPKPANWSIYTQDNLLNPECTVNLSYTCSSTSKPTQSPTHTPTTLAPTPVVPTMAPTKNPTMSPTKNPTRFPTHIPTANPTSSPVDACGGLLVSGTDFLNGKYRKANDTINSKSYWTSITTDGIIFWSTSVSHLTWVLWSEDNEKYWLAKRKTPTQPPDYGQWDLYVGSSPFVTNTSYLNFTCRENAYPTPAPTTNPTNVPTNPPTITPSSTPTIFPTIFPTFAPTIIPTTIPTNSPTPSPSDAPTRQSSEYLVVWTSAGEKSFEGFFERYQYNATSKDNQWRKIDDDGDHLIYYDFDKAVWILYSSASDEKYYTAYDNWRPPEEADWYRYSSNRRLKDRVLLATPTRVPTKVPTGVPTRFPTGYPTLIPTKFPTGFPTKFPTGYPTEIPTKNPTGIPTIVPTGAPSIAPTAIPTLSPTDPTSAPTSIPTMVLETVHIYISFSDTLLPTNVPTIMPSNAPTESPTSPCNGLNVFSSNTSFNYAGWYSKQSGLVNNNYWWKNTHLSTSIRYQNGHWYILTDENSVDYIADSSYVSVFPPSGTWYEQQNGDSYIIQISCYDTQAPTPYPTKTPTTTPTTNEPPVWSGCDGIYYGFVEGLRDGNVSVYWETPNVTDSDGDDLIITYPEYTSGDGLEAGEYILTYTATDEQNASASCNITVIVINGASYDSLEYCQYEKFFISTSANTSYSEVDLETIVYTLIKTVEGMVYHPTLAEVDQNCWVTANIVTQSDFIVISEDAATTSFLGISAASYVWQIIILIIVIIVICLVCIRLRDWYAERNKKNDDEETKRLLEAHQNDSQQEQGGYVAPTTSAKLPETSSRQNEKKEEEKEEEEKKSPALMPMSGNKLPPASDIELEIIEPPVVNQQKYWQSQLDTLFASGYTNQEKNLDLLIKNVVKNEDGTTNKEKTQSKVNSILYEESKKPFKPGPQLQSAVVESPRVKRVDSDDEALYDPGAGGLISFPKAQKQDNEPIASDNDDDEDILPPSEVGPPPIPFNTNDHIDALMVSSVSILPPPIPQGAAGPPPPPSSSMQQQQQPPKLPPLPNFEGMDELDDDGLDDEYL